MTATPKQLRRGTQVHDVPTVWGLDARGLHDRFWADHGVLVVRRGGPEPQRGGPTLHLLLDHDELVLFDTRDALRNLPRRGVLRLRIVHDDARPYSERVIIDGSGKLARIRREYAPPTARSPDVLLTRDAALASRWHAAAHCCDAERAVRVAAGLHRFRVASGHGQAFSATDRSECHRFCLSLMTRWSDPAGYAPGLRSLPSGACIHGSASVDPGARLVGPVWVGAGVSVRDGDVVVGPCLLADEVPVEPPAPPVVRSRTRPTRPAPRGAADVRAPRRQQFGRRLFDLAFSALALVLAAPLWPLIMLLIWLEDGRPFFFIHVRQTVGGREFACYKFRTMYRNAEQLKDRLAALNVCDGPQFHIENDPRLLRVGRFLRRYHLDELPQFVNVLLGQMSVIGPRPSPDDENQFCPAWRDARLSVKPGVTGLWQVVRTRSPDHDFQEWIRHDLEYVERQSWHLDLLILCKTAGDLVGRLVTRARRPRDGGTPGGGVTPGTGPIATIGGSDDEGRRAA